MNPPDITESDLHAFVDDALEPERRLEVTEYLAAHPEEAQRVESYRRQHDQLHAAFAPIAREPIPERLNLQRMIEAHSRSNSRHWRSLAAAVALVAFGAIGGWTVRRAVDPANSTGIAALTQEATDSFALFASDRVRPVEVRDRPQMIAWASKRLDWLVEAPDLTTQGYRFMGGRLLATTHGPAVLFMYDDDRGSRLVFLSRRMRVEQNMPLTPQPHGHVAGFSWAEKGIGFSLVGNVSSQLLQPVAAEARRQLTRAT